MRKHLAILVCGLLVIGVGVNATPSEAAQCSTTIRLAYSSSCTNDSRTENFAVEMLRLVNAARARAGVAPLRLSTELMYACGVRAREITQSFSHTRPNGERFSTIIRGSDGYYTCGENIAAGNATVAETFEQWMNSRGHRANILNPDYTELGVGYAYVNKGYSHYWVQLFKRPLSRTYRR